MNIGPVIDAEYRQLFDLVKEARQLAFDLIRSRLEAGGDIRGCEVDACLQEFFRQRGMDQYLMHRTGHSIGHRCHGVGANLDDYETHDDRKLLPGTMFSIEPGIYTSRYGVRLEYDVHITSGRQLRIYGPVQEEILVI